MEMRIAFPVNKDDGLNAEIFEHFGHAPFYLLVDISNNYIGNITTIANSYRDVHGPGDVPRLLADHKVNILICRGMGRKAVEYFNSLGIKVIRGPYGYVKEVLDDYLNGLLKSIDYKPEKKWGEM